MDHKQQKIGFIKSMNRQQQSLVPAKVEVRPKANRLTKYQAAAAKFGACKSWTSTKS